MPPPPGSKKKKKGRAPKHQNTFAFRHNAKSKKTEKILSSPNVGVCRRCWEKIEWRKKYRKYKPRTQPGKCNICFNRNVMAAYHTICAKCTVSDAAIAAMEKHQGEAENPEENENDVAESSVDTINTDTDGNAMKQDEAPVQPTEDSSTTKVERPKRKIKVCAVCTNEPALSKYDNMPPEASELVSQIQELEDVLDSGIAEDGHKLTLREVKTIERQLEKLKLEIKNFGKKKGDDGNEDEQDDDEEEQEDDGDDEESSGEESDNDVDEEEEEDDPFLKAVGGKDKLLVGDAFQQMLLAKAEAQKSS